MDNKEDKSQEQPQAPIVIMGGTAFSLSELLNAENNPEVMAKKEKAHDQALKRKRRPRIRRQ